MLKNKMSRLIMTVFIGLVFAVVPVSFAQAAEEAADVEFDDAITSSIEIGEITFVSGKPSITVSNLPVGAIVKAYDSVTEKLLGSATVKTGDSAIVTLSSVNNDVEVSVTLESKRSIIKIDETEKLAVDTITVINNAGTADIVTVTDLEVGDTIYVYKPINPKLLGKATVAKGKTEAVVSISQLGDDEGEVQVTLASVGKKVSPLSDVITYEAEPQSFSLGDHNIEVKNNAGIADTVKVTDLGVGDIVKVYNALSEGKLLGKATVAKGKTETTVSIRQLGIAKAAVYVAVTSIGKMESERLPSEYDAEEVTILDEAAVITVKNNNGSNDTVDVTNLQNGDIVNVYFYDAATKKVGKLLGKSIAKELKTTITIRQLGSDAGSIWVTVTTPTKQVSAGIEATYDKQLLLSQGTDVN